MNLGKNTKKKWIAHNDLIPKWLPIDAWPSKAYFLPSDDVPFKNLGKTGARARSKRQALKRASEINTMHTASTSEGVPASASDTTVASAATTSTSLSSAMGTGANESGAMDTSMDFPPDGLQGIGAVSQTTPQMPEKEKVGRKPALPLAELYRVASACCDKDKSDLTSHEISCLHLVARHVLGQIGDTDSSGKRIRGATIHTGGKPLHLTCPTKHEKSSGDLCRAQRHVGAAALSRAINITAGDDIGHKTDMLTTVGRVEKEAYIAAATQLGLAIVGRLSAEQTRQIMREAKLTENQVRTIGSFFNSEKGVNLFAPPKKVKSARERKEHVRTAALFSATLYTNALLFV